MTALTDITFVPDEPENVRRPKLKALLDHLIPAENVTTALAAGHNFSINGGGITAPTVNFDGTNNVVLVPTVGDIAPTSVASSGAISGLTSLAIGSTSLVDPITGTSKARVSDGTMVVSFRDHSSPGQGWLAVGNGTMTGFVGHTNASQGFTFGSFTNHPVMVRVNNAGVMQFDTSGRVGIGSYGTGAPPALTNTLEVAGTISATGKATLGGGLNLAAGFKETGFTVSRFENTGGNVPVGATGQGLEIFGSFSGTSVLQSYNRTSLAYGSLFLDGATIAMRPGGTAVGVYSSTGLAVTGAVSASGGLTVSGSTKISAYATGVTQNVEMFTDSGSQSIIQSGVGSYGIDFKTAYAPGNGFRFYPQASASAVATITTSGLAVTGATSGTGTFRSTGQSPTAGLAGLGLEMQIGGGVQGEVFAYNRTSSAYAPLVLAGSTVNLQSGGTVIGAISSTGLAVTGTVTASDLITSTGFRDKGGVFARFEGSGTSVPTGSTGPGVEVYQSGGNGYVQSYNRTTAAFIPFNIGGSQVNFQINSSTVATVSSTGLAVTGTISASGTISSQSAGALQQFILGSTSNGNTGGQVFFTGAGGANIVGLKGAWNGAPGGALTISAHNSTSLVDVATFNSTGLALTGALNVAGGVKQTGSNVFRVENTAGAPVAGSVGLGLEMGVTGGTTAYIEAFDRTGLARGPLGLYGTSITLNGPASCTSTFAATGNLSTLGNLSVGTTGSVATASPIRASLGGSYSSVAGANLKLPIYDDGTPANNYGFGVSASQLDYVVPTAANHSFWVAGSKYASVSATGLVSVGFRDTGPGPARFESAAGLPAAGAAGPGLEISQSSIKCYNRTSSAYVGLGIDALNTNISASGIGVVYIDSTGANVSGDMVATNLVKGRIGQFSASLSVTTTILAGSDITCQTNIFATSGYVSSQSLKVGGIANPGIEFRPVASGTWSGLAYLRCGVSATGASGGDYMAVTVAESGKHFGVLLNNKLALDVSETGVAVKGTLGYQAGGAVTQLTDKATDVTLNKSNGQITLTSAALAGGAAVSFNLLNTLIAATDTMHINIGSGAATGGSYLVQADQFAAGSCRISVRNLTAGSLSEALVLNFAIIKAVNA
jgi:hypothetical protein